MEAAASADLNQAPSLGSWLGFVSLARSIIAFGTSALKIALGSRERRFLNLLGLRNLHGTLGDPLDLLKPLLRTCACAF